jgi:hypothetical protein
VLSVGANTHHLSLRILLLAPVSALPRSLLEDRRSAQSGLDVRAAPVEGIPVSWELHLSVNRFPTFQIPQYPQISLHFFESTSVTSAPIHPFPCPSNHTIQSAHRT